MIVIKLKGGLGNQLFQYAYGIYVSKKYEQPLAFNKSNFNNSKRKYCLDWFNIDIAEAPKKKILTNHLNDLIKKIKIKTYSYLSKVYDENCIGAGEYEGYWHSIKYAEFMKTELKKTITPRTISKQLNIMIQEVKSKNSVMVHVRRGDYVFDKKIKKIFGPCDKHYYNNAITEVHNLVPSSTFYIFSDDIKWAKKNLNSNISLNFINNSFSENEQFWLMTKCNHHIISNSSFSWWAAWLTDDKKKITIYPDPWFDRLNFNKNIFLNHWLKRKKNV